MAKKKLLQYVIRNEQNSVDNKAKGRYFVRTQIVLETVVLEKLTKIFVAFNLANTGVIIICSS